MADKLIEEEIAKKTKTPSFYEEKENNAALYNQINSQAHNALFDNTHKTENLQKVYEEIDKQKAAKAEEIKTEGYDNFNPFYGDKNALEKMSSHNYKEVVEVNDNPSETLEIKQKIDVKPIARKEKKVQRKHLWITTISICLVLFGFVFGYNMFSINSLAQNTAKTQHKINEIEQTMVDNADTYSDLIADSGMVQADIENASKVDLLPQNTTPRYTEKSSAWDRFCDFFARMFGK